MQICKHILFLFAVIFGLASKAQEIEYSQGIYNFYENKGQWPNGVLYKASVPGGNIWLEQGRVLYHFQDYSALQRAHIGEGIEHDDPTHFKQDLIAANFVGANLNVKPTQLYPTKEYQNFFIGNIKSRWASDVKGYNQVAYPELYPGITLKFFEKEGDLKYEFIVAPNSNPAQIKIKYQGHQNIKINPKGSLIITSKLGEIQELKPYVYQIKNGRIIPVTSSFILNNDEVTFELGKYDKSIELVIDPVLVFATYSGAFSDNFGMTATYAYDGKAYSGGTLYGNSYPTPAPAWNTSTYITIPAVGVVTTDVFLSKYSADGKTMIWTNFIGGGDNTQGTETVHSLICDKQNNVYLYGVTSSLDFPVVGGFQETHAGGTNLSISSNGTNFGAVGTDIYIAKFSWDGLDLMGSTYIGGSLNDGVNYKVSSGSYPSPASYDSLTKNYGDQYRGEIMVDSLNNIYIASSSRSTDFPTVAGFQMTNNGMQDAVIFKVSADFSTLIWSTYFGGTKNDAGYSVKLDSKYNVIVAGGTTSSVLVGMTGGYQPTYNGGKADGYILKIKPDGTAVIQGSFVGTPDYDQTFFVEIDRYDNIYLLGQTFGAMPVSFGVYNNPGSSQFIWKFAPDLLSTEFITVFGNGSPTINISPSAFLVDVCGNIYVSGWGGSVLGGAPLTGMPISGDALYPTTTGFDFYLMVLERGAKSLLYATYIGGKISKEHVDGGTSRFDKYGIVYQSVCGGCGGNSDFSCTPGAHSAVNNSSNCNNLIFKFDFEIIPLAKFQVAQLKGCAPLTLNFKNESNDTINFEWDFGPGSEILSGGASPNVLFTEPGTYEVTLLITDTICNLTDTAVKIITVYDELKLSVPNDTIVCDEINYTIAANSYGTANSFIWSTDLSFGTVLNDSPMDSSINVNPITTTTYYVKASNGWELCDLIDSVTVTFVSGAMEVSADLIICEKDSVFLTAKSIIDEIEIDFDWSPSKYILSQIGGIAIGIPPSSMYYYVTGISESGCVIKDSVWVEVTKIDESTIYATATPDILAEGTTTFLEAFPMGYEYMWYPSDGVENPSSRTTNAVVNKTRTFDVYMTNGICTAKTQVTVKTYEFVCGDVYVYVPNAFSPNGDNKNDVLYVRGKNLENIQFKIFDRWGELLFESTDQNVGWDGTFKGVSVNPDVYVYHLKITCFDGQENLIKGNVTVLK